VPPYDPRLAGLSAIGVNRAIEHLRVAIPTDRLDQLCLLADARGELATEMVTDLVLRFLDEEDPDGALRSTPARTCADGSVLAPVIRLPRATRWDETN
jgi:hypothetical protein